MGLLANVRQKLAELLWPQPKTTAQTLTLPAPAPVEAIPAAPKAAMLDEATVVELARYLKSAATDAKPAVDSMMTAFPYGPQSPQAGAFGLADPWKFVNNMGPNHHPGSAISVQTLRDLVANWDVLSSIIAHLQREVSNAPFQIVAIDPNDDSPQTKQQIAEATAFFTREGGLGGNGEYPWQFEYSWIRDLCTVGAAGFFLWPYRDGSLYQIVNVDAITLKPIIDGYGWPIFGEDDPAFEQWVYGIPVQQFSRKELIYDGIYKRAETPYYISPVETLISTITGALAADQWNRDWLTDGNVPDQLIGLPDTWSPTQIKEFAAWFDMLLAGNIKMRSKARFVPGGTKVLEGHSRQEQQFAEYEYWLLKRACSAFGVTPASIGFADGQFKGTQDASLDMTSAFGVGALLTYKVSHYNDFLKRGGWDRVAYQHVPVRYEKPMDRAQRNQLLVMNGIKTINEARRDEGLPPLPDGNTLIVQSAMIPLDIALKAQPQTTAKGAGEPTDKRDNNSAGKKD